MTRTDAPMKTRDLAAILYRSYNDCTSTQNTETVEQAEAAAKKAAVAFFATHDLSAEK